DGLGTSTNAFENVNTLTSPCAMTASAAAASIRLRSDLPEIFASIEPLTSTSTTVFPGRIGNSEIASDIAWSSAGTINGHARAAATYRNGSTRRAPLRATIADR